MTARNGDESTLGRIVLIFGFRGCRLIPHHPVVRQQQQQKHSGGSGAEEGAEVEEEEEAAPRQSTILLYIDGDPKRPKISPVTHSNSVEI